MTYTNFPDGITSMGVPVGGMFMNGKTFFVKPGTLAGGNDGNDGRGIDTPLATCAQAHSLMTADANDVAYLLSSSATAINTSDSLTSTLVWSKDLSHLVGVNAGNRIGQRSRIAALSTATGTNLAPLVTWSADGCYCTNIQFISELASADAIGGVVVSGERNHFKNCHFAGAANSTQDVAGQYSLKVTGSENLFEDCVIGIDTVSRSTATYEMQLSGGATRNIFRNCVILTYAGANTMRFLDVPATGIDRFVLFENCTFINPVQSAAVAMTEAFSVATGTSPNGMILLKNCTMIGATDWEANVESGRTYIDGAAPTNNTSGIAVLVEAT